MNLTITVPDGSSSHGNPNLLCTPPNWFDYILFYVSNYFAHAATVITTPGQGKTERIFVVLAALLLPGSGVTRAIKAMRRHSGMESDPLKRAVRAGALCMVVRAEPRKKLGRCRLETGQVGVLRAKEEQYNRGAEGQQEEQWWNPDRGHLLPDDAVIHGHYRLPEGYRLALVPIGAAGELESTDEDSCKALSSSYNFPKILVSFIQAIWAIITLYRARGDQIQQYGYAAFGLTVAPYAFMSIMNIIGTFLNPDYPAIFMARTPLMTEAESESAGGFFAGEVLFKAVEGRSHTTYSSRPYDGYKMSNEERDRVVDMFIGTFVGIIPLVIIGGLSRFQAQNSTSLQRGFTISWLVLGIIVGGLWMDDMTVGGIGNRIANFFIYSVPAVGGMVVVGQMIRDYGICTLLR